MQSVPTSTAQIPASGQDDELIDAVLGASRVFVTVAARSLAALAEDVTLAQHRVLVELDARGPQRLADLAGVLTVERSTATRMCDRLVRKRLVARRRISTDRRGVRVALTPGGRELIGAVSDRRRRELTRIVHQMPSADRNAVVRTLRAFAAVAGEVPEQDWSLGWTVSSNGRAAPERGLEPRP